MSLLHKDEKQSLRQRLSLWLMTGGIVVLLGSLVGAFVVVPVLLLQSSRRKEAEEQEAQHRAEAKTSSAPASEEKKPATPKVDPGIAKVAPPPKPAVPEPAKPAKVEPQQISVAPPPAPVSPVVVKDASAVDPEGFIRNWLVLAPIRSAQLPFSGAQEIHKTQLPQEARLRPKDGDRASAPPDKERVWQRYTSPDFFIDFQKIVGAGRSEDAIAYAVCYVHAPQAMTGLKLQMGSNDHAKVYLNGAHLLVFDKTRTLGKDQSTANDVQLLKGENLVVFKVVNEKNAWQGCIRFTDKNNQPVRTLQISLTPQ
jgi:hypothetical protein